MYSINELVQMCWGSVYVCMLLLTGSGWGMVIPPTENVDIISEPCTLVPNNSGLPCVMYTIDSKYCGAEGSNLPALFPHLYEVEDPSVLTWPSDVLNNKVVNNTIAWEARAEGSIRYLKGYQIYETGADFDTMGLEICKIIDLSNVTKDQYQLLSNTFFMLTNTEGGEMAVTIKALPLPALNTSAPTAMAMPPPPQVYHPNLTLSVDYVQLNASAVNVSLKVTPVVKDLHVMVVRVLRNQTCLQELHVPVSKEYFAIGNLTEGTYRLQLIPEDNSNFGTKGPCLCYLGNQTRSNCVACMRYTKEISLVSNTVAEREGTSVAAIAGTVVTLVAMAAILVVFWYLLRITGRLPHWLRCFVTLGGNQSEASTGTTARKRHFTLQILYAYDHAAHNDSVKALAALMKTSLRCRVLLNGLDESFCYDTSNTSLSSQESYREDTPVTCESDMFLFVHSDWVDRLVKAVQAGEVTPSDVANQNDHSFLFSFNELCTNPDLRDRTVSLKFVYSSETSVIREPFLGVLFTLPDNTDALLNHIRHRLSPNTITKPAISPADKLNLTSNVNAAFMFQTKHRLWLKTKLFSLKASHSSDDSGVVVSRRRRDKSRSLRSRSADTLTCHVCQSALNRRNVCENCDQIGGSRLRSNSCSISFFPPENEEDASVGFSLLETRFADINERYVSRNSITQSVV